MKKSIIIIVVVILLVLVGLFLVRSRSKMPMNTQSPKELTEEQLGQLKTGEVLHSPTTLTFNVTAGGFYFAPNVIRVRKGDTVKIVLTNAGGHHNFVIDEFNVKMEPTDSGQVATVEFIADKIGTFEYYCGIGSHRQLGQKGTLIVE